MQVETCILKEVTFSVSVKFTPLMKMGGCVKIYLNILSDKRTSHFKSFANIKLLFFLQFLDCKL